MARAVFSVAAIGIASFFGAPQVGIAIAGMVGGFLGGLVDNAIMGKNRNPTSKEDLTVQISSYGAPIPRVYGMGRLAGNVIWARDIDKRKAGGGGKGFGGGAQGDSYEYYGTFAIAICAGPISAIKRVWADSKLLTADTLNTSSDNYNYYLGTESQLPDPIIESFEGAGNVPAFRGLAYIVVQNFPLAEYGNRIPNFTFEVQNGLYGADPVHSKIKQILLSPGYGEFAYSTTVQKAQPVLKYLSGSVPRGEAYTLNVHTPGGEADIVMSLRQALTVFPNIDTIGLPIAWFASGTDAGSSQIIPGVEFPDGYGPLETITTSPQSWQVGSFVRQTARLLTYDGGKAIFGGTPSDGSLLEAITYIKSLKNANNVNLKVTLFPRVIVDASNKPDSRRITAKNPTDASAFFTGAYGYNAFIRYYAGLTGVKNKIDGIVLGWGLDGLFKQDFCEGAYPAVTELKALAALVKGTDLAAYPAVKVICAADWDSYHSLNGDFYLDPLWTDTNVDVVGINAHFPLTEDLLQKDITYDKVKSGWESGEGFTYYWNTNRTVKTNYATPTYAWKNHEYWYENTHPGYGPNLTAQVSAFDNAAWTKTRGTIATVNGADPNGGTRAELFLETATTGLHSIAQTITTPVNAEHVFVLQIKPAGRTRFILKIDDNSATNSNVYVEALLTGNGSIISSGAGGNGVFSSSSSVAVAGNGFYTITVQGTPNSSGGGSAVGLTCILHDGTSPSYAGNASLGAWLYGGKCQRTGVNTAWTVRQKPIWFTSLGFPSVDAATNQPDAVYPVSSIDSAYPRKSKKTTNNEIQTVALGASLAYLQERNVLSGNSNLVPKAYVQEWDVRPYPQWPTLTAIWPDTGNYAKGYSVQGKVELSNLSTVVNSLMLTCGYTAQDFDTAGIDNLQIDGIIINNTSSIRSALAQLQFVYMFDLVESDGKLTFIRRGGDPVVTIPKADIVCDLTEDVKKTVASVRKQELDLPKTVALTYVDRDSDYENNTQLAARQATSSTDTFEVEVPVTLSADRARAVADALLYSMWANRHTYTFTLPKSYMWLRPADPVTLDIDGRMISAKIVSTTVTKNAQEIQAVSEDPSVYESYYSGGAGILRTSSYALTTETVFHLLDIPALPLDSGANGVLRVAARGAGRGWAGSVLYRSLDGGVAASGTFTRYGSNGTDSTIGQAITVLGVGITDTWDNANTVDVVLPSSTLTLSSKEELSVLNGANLALLGDELIQFKSAVLQSTSNTYRLSGLLRGRQGTEQYVGAHVAGERFILLDSSVQANPVSLDAISVPAFYKNVTVGKTLADTAEVAFTYTGVSLTPWSPVNLTATKSLSTGALVLAWQRRTRFGGQWQDKRDVPLNEATESYEIDILNLAGTAVLRTLETSTPYVTYTQADQITDFGTAQTSINFSVYQMSAAIGRGYAGNALITATLMA